MVGQYSKNNLLVRALRRKYPEENFDEFGLSTRLKRKYNPAVLDLSPKMSKIISSIKSSPITYKEDNPLDNFHAYTNDVAAVNSGLSIASVVPMGLKTVSNIGTNAGAINSVSNIGKYVAEGSKLANTLGTATGIIGGGLSAVGLSTDIAKAIEDKHVSFDNAMKMADDGTGLVSAVISTALPGVGSAIGIGLEAGEKLVTGIIKGAKAVKEEKAKNIEGETYTDRKGKIHLKPRVWLDTVVGANVPEWMGLQIGSKEWKQYWSSDKNAKNIEKASKKEQKKKAKAARKEIWKHGTTKEKVRDFFFG